MYVTSTSLYSPLLKNDQGTNSIIIIIIIIMVGQDVDEQLTREQKLELKQLLDELTMERDSIGDAMIWCMKKVRCHSLLSHIYMCACVRIG